MKTCQYCSRSIAGFHLVLTRHNIGGQCVSASGAPRPQGIISVWRHHPVAVCLSHYEQLPVHVNHWQNGNPISQVKQQLWTNRLDFMKFRARKRG